MTKKTRAVPDQRKRATPAKKAQVKAPADHRVARKDCGHPRARRKWLGYASICQDCGQVVR